MGKPPRQTELDHASEELIGGNSNTPTALRSRRWKIKGETAAFPDTRFLGCRSLLQQPRKDISQHRRACRGQKAYAAPDATGGIAQHKIVRFQRIE
ncbi:hypothetical protein BAE41_29310 [Mesorhizobium loti]|nr:hypothetical protein BAE41_29310 [Mesorhizobium loti]